MRVIRASIRVELWGQADLEKMKSPGRVTSQIGHGEDG
jgi:hypothetical protein